MINGILSMQRIYNYGSWLQSYALKNIIESIDPSSVQFVDYRVNKPITAHGKGYIKYLIKRGINAGVEVATSNRLFASLTRSGEVNRVYNFKHSYQPALFGADRMRKNYTPTLDNLIIGSDEVFNCIQSNPRVGYSCELFGVNSPAKQKVSYAASFGNTTLEKIRAYGKEAEMTDWLNGLDRISVRDRNSFEIVKELTGKTPEIHLDPVLMYDFSKELSEEFEPLQDKYIIIYTYANRLQSNEMQYIKDYARSHGLKIVGINAYYDILDRMVYDSPLNVLKWFKHAECIVTDTFHGTIFSVINHKPFASIIRTSENGSYGNQEKLFDLLNRISLTDHIVKAPEQIEAILDSSVNYEETDAIIAKEREHTREYLTKILK